MLNYWKIPLLGPAVFRGDYPTGNFSLRQALGVIVGIAFAILSQQYWIADKLLASFAAAVGGGFASAAIATGSLKAGLWGAVSAAVFWGIGTAFSELQYAGPKPGANNLVEAVFKRASSGNAVAKIAAHAVAGGTLTELQGGKFGHGFIAAGFTEALSPAVGQIQGEDFGSVVSRTAASAAIGGTASALSGGSFANGAKTAAFQQLFSYSISGKRSSSAMAASRKTEEGVPYEMVAPPEIDALLKQYPYLEGLMKETMDKSTAWLNKEHGFVAYKIEAYGLSEKLNVLWIEQFTGTRYRIDIHVRSLPGMRPVLVYHTHPFYPGHGHNFWTALTGISFGPSIRDWNHSIQNPSAHYIMDDLSNRYYFGQMFR